MNEETIGFAFLLLVAAASVFSLLFMQNDSLTGQVSYERPTILSDEVPPYGDECAVIRCPYSGYAAIPVLDEWGRPARNKYGSYGPGNVVCICPITSTAPAEGYRLQVP